MGSEAPVLAAEDLALLERVAARVVELHLEVPAVLSLESVRPLSFVASQVMFFFQPLVQALLRWNEYERFAGLAGRREAIEALVAMIERRAGGAGAGPTGSPMDASGHGGRPE